MADHAQEFIAHRERGVVAGSFRGDAGIGLLSLDGARDEVHRPFDAQTVIGARSLLSEGFVLQRPFLDDWLRWAGIDDVTGIEFRPNLATADADTARRAAHAAARDVGKTF